MAREIGVQPKSGVKSVIYALLCPVISTILPDADEADLCDILIARKTRSTWMSSKTSSSTPRRFSSSRRRRCRRALWTIRSGSVAQGQPAPRTLETCRPSASAPLESEPSARRRASAARRSARSRRRRSPPGCRAETRALLSPRESLPSARPLPRPVPRPPPRLPLPLRLRPPSPRLPHQRLAPPAPPAPDAHPPAPAAAPAAAAPQEKGANRVKAVIEQTRRCSQTLFSFTAQIISRRELSLKPASKPT